MRYEKYKNSGIEWIGEIPQHWETKKIKYISKLQGGYAFKSDSFTEVGIPIIRIGDIKDKIDWDSCKKIPEDLDIPKEFLLNKNDTLIALSGATTGKCAFLSEEPKKSYINQRVAKVNFDNKLLYFNISGDFIQKLILLTADGSAQENISNSQIENIIITLPISKSEQTAIANYLDRKTAEIDELIAQKEQLLKLYEEEKNAIINQAVTKGLTVDYNGINDDQDKTEQSTKSVNHTHQRFRHFKDSGIEWLGEIPAHWDVKKLKYVAEANPSNIDKKSKDNEDEIFLCNYVDVYNNDFISGEIDFMKATANKNQIKKFILKKGDVIATKDSETPDDIANPALVIQDFDNVVCGYHLTHIRPVKIIGDYLFRLFQSKILQAYFEVSANGVTRYGISVDKFNSVLILLPPKEEQSAIVAHIEKETARIDAKMEKTKKLIELLKEYRTALISEAVTGKIKVPGV